MEDLVAFDLRSGKPTNFGAAFKHVAQFLHASEVPYVFVGTLALNTYVRPRVTQEIKLICDSSVCEQFDGVLKRIAAQAGFGGCISAQSPSHPAMEYALASPRMVALFDTYIPVPTAQALGWLLFETNNLNDKVDAGSLLATGVVVSNELQFMLEQHGSQAALIGFQAVKRDIEQGRYSGTYNDSIQARLQRLRHKGADAS